MFKELAFVRVDFEGGGFGSQILRGTNRNSPKLEVQGRDHLQ